MASETIMYIAFVTNIFKYKIQKMTNVYFIYSLDT